TKHKVLSSFFFRDSATGSTSDFGSEDVGSTPPPGARRRLPIVNCRLPIVRSPTGKIGNRQSAIKKVLWDGANGNTLRSERRNEGSSPSPAAKNIADCQLCSGVF